MTAAASASPAMGVRERARAEMTAQITAVARAHLAKGGASGLSLRAIAREMGMSSSAVYRYVQCRDDLLTTLIVEAYDSLGAAAEAAESAVPRSELAGRFRAVAMAVRGWAMENEHEYALIFGSPVPGYRAPQTTVGPATRVPGLLIGIIQDGVAAGMLSSGGSSGVTSEAAADLPDDLMASMAPVLASFAEQSPPVAPPLVARALMVWTYLFGAVSFDLFGHRHNVVLHERAVDNPFFSYEVDQMIRLVGLVERE